MKHSSLLIAGVGLADRARKSRWPARLDLTQSATGFVLVLFMWGHMFFVSSILVGKDAMWTITKFFEGYFFFGASYPWIVSIVVAAVIALIVAHALLAVRKFPINYRQFQTFRGHMRMIQHEDTTLWFWQVFTGFALFFLASVHLYIMLTRPDRIGPFESSDRVWSEHLWPLYILLAAGGRAAWRHRSLPPRGEMGLARRRRCQRDAASAQDAQVGDHRVLPRAGLGDAGGVYQDRHRTPRPLRRALRSSTLATLPQAVAPADGLDAHKASRESDLYRCPGHRRRPRRASHGHRRQAPRPRRRHPVAGPTQALALVRGAGRHAGEPRQRRQGAGRQRGRAFRGHGARQRLGRRPASGAHVRQYGAEGDPRARRMGRAVEPRAEGRPRGHHQWPEGRRSPSATKRTAC